MPTRLKKRYSILLSDEIAERFERVTCRRNGAKTAIIEEMLDQRLNPERYPLMDEGILRRLDELSNEVAYCRDRKGVAWIGRSSAVLAQVLYMKDRCGLLSLTLP